MSESVLPMFSSRSFIVSGLMFRSLIHFEFIFVYGVRKCSSFIARTWKQLRCPSADEWIRKLWYIYTMEYYSAIKKNTMESVLMRWMKLESIIQSEVSQKEKHQYSMLLLLLSCFSHVRLCVTPETAAHQAPLSLGFSRQEHWSGLPFSSPVAIHIHCQTCLLSLFF